MPGGGPGGFSPPHFSSLLPDPTRCQQTQAGKPLMLHHIFPVRMDSDRAPLNCKSKRNLPSLQWLLDRDLSKTIREINNR